MDKCSIYDKIKTPLTVFISSLLAVSIQTMIYTSLGIINKTDNTTINNNAMQIESEQELFTKIGSHTMWKLREHVSGENELVIENISSLIDEGYTNFDVYNIVNSVSYYCKMNNITPLLGTIKEVYKDDNNLTHTIIDIGPVVVDQIYDSVHLMQRVDYIDGDDRINNFGTFYENMYPDKKIEFYDMYASHGGIGSLYAVKEFNCCWILYGKVDGENKYIRIEKDTNEVTDTGTYTDSGERTSDE